jgi:hypothetical protein
MLLCIYRDPPEDEAGPRGSALVLALAEGERPRAAGGSTGLFRVWLDPRVALRSNLQVRFARAPELSDRIVPHFEAYPLRGAKRHSSGGFAEVCQMIGQGDHLRPDGMADIVRIATEMNLGKRRYSAATLLRTLSEVKG